MGKGCVRFKKLDDLALNVVGETVARVSVEEHIANYRAARAKLKKYKEECRMEWRWKPRHGRGADRLLARARE